MLSPPLLPPRADPTGEVMTSVASMGRLGMRSSSSFCEPVTVTRLVEDQDCNQFYDTVPRRSAGESKLLSSNFP